MRVILSNLVRILNKGFLILLILFFLIACSISPNENKGNSMADSSKEPNQIIKDNEVKDMALTISSPAFENNATIPIGYTCQGDDVNPALRIENIPANAISMVLIMDDPDAQTGNWNHWVMWNISKITDFGDNSVPANAVVGRNSWGKNQYGGPCPATGKHRYFFKLYALDIWLHLDASAGKHEVEAAMQGHVIESAQFVGLYKKE